MKLLKSIYGCGKRVQSRITARLESALFSRKNSVVRQKTLLIVKLDSIGDYVLFRDFIEVLKSSPVYKGYRITFCGNSWWKDLAETLDKNYVDEFIWVEYNKLHQRKYRWSIFKTLRQLRFEVMIHPTYSRDVYSDAVALNCGAPVKIGSSGDLINLSATQKEKNDKAYTRLIHSTNVCQFEFFRNLNFFRDLLGFQPNITGPKIKVSVPETNRIVICPGAKVEWRRWSPLKFAGLCDRLKENFPGISFVICGSDSDNQMAEKIMESSAIQYVNLCGKLTLSQLLNELASARLIVTNDSGPFHIAVALGKKTVCVSNGNNYGRFTPYPSQMETQSKVVYPKQLIEINSQEERLARYCKEGSNLDINEIEISEVYDRIMELKP